MASWPPFSETADFEKIDEIHFRLGIIYKQLQRYTESLQVSQTGPGLSSFPVPCPCPVVEPLH